MENNPKLSFRKMNLRDVFTFRNWGRNDSPLFLEYNFIEESEEDIIEWFKWKTKRPLSEYFVIESDERIIGYLSLKNINKILKKAELGVVLDPNYINQGIGKKILGLFLTYLKDRGFKKIILFVADYNKRAKRCYEGLGFKKSYSFLMKFPNGAYDENIPDFYENKSSFKIILNRTFNYATKMDLDLERDW